METTIEHLEGFEWDKGNSNKNPDKHNVSNSESEEPFFNSPVIIFNDEKHSQKENRQILLGKTDSGRELIIVYTWRGRKIRIISARDMNRKEKEVFQKL